MRARTSPSGTLSLRVLLARSLVHYWRTNLAVVLGVATAVSVLAGARVVGDSVRSSLRALALERLGRTDVSVLSTGFFRETLAGDLAARPGFASTFAGAVPLIAMDGLVTHEGSGRRASGVLVYGVDERFWRFHGLAPPSAGPREALPSEPLAAELGASPGDTLLLRVEQPSDVPSSTLYGRRDEIGHTLRLVAGAPRPTAELGEFALRPRQQAVRALFAPLGLLQRALGRDGAVNAVVLDALPARESDAGAAPAAVAALRAVVSLEDVGVQVRTVAEGRALSLERDRALLDDGLAQAGRAAAARLGLSGHPVLTYLATTLRVGAREVPYSLVTALEGATWQEVAGEAKAGHGPDPIVLNEWAARELAARPGDRVTLEYYVWLEEGRLLTRAADFTLRRAVPMTGLAADRDLTPEYPGITASARLSDWDPPFPVDLARVRPQDEAYWERHRATPKAFIPLARGQELWRHRLGQLTSLRIAIPAGQDGAAVREAYADALREALDPAGFGFSVQPARAQALQAAEGASDFGEYFLYFSSFLVASALLLAGLFFRFGVEQRLREVGLLRALGFTPRRIGLGLMLEGSALALAGALAGAAGAWAYAAVIVWALRTWWVDAVGTTRLGLHASPVSLLVGALAGVLTALACIALTLRGLRRVSARALLTGNREEAGSPAATGGRAGGLAALGLVASLALLLAAAAGAVPAPAAFFGAGTLLLASALACQWRWLRGRAGLPPPAARRQVAWLGFRNASYRPGRSVLCIALIAAATFLIVSVGAFRRDARAAARDPRGPAGGYALVAQSLLPLHHDPHTPDGREALNLAAEPALEGVRFTRFRLRPGDDASCLNLYRPQDPAVLAPSADFLRANRFSFQATLAESPAERANPWLLLERDAVDGAIPVIADASSLAYVLHRELGEELTLPRAGQPPLRMRVVGALRNGLFQGELLMGERHFLQAFPDRQGFRFFLLDVPPGGEAAVSAALETRLADYGFDVLLATERLARYDRVENTYLSTFQSLGGLGLLLGTVGLAAVLLRNALERRRELALLRAVGYRRDHLSVMVLAENALLLALGLGTGTACALVAIAPAVMERGGRFPGLALGGLLLAVAAVGLLVSRLAVAAIHRAPILAALRSE